MTRTSDPLSVLKGMQPTFAAVTALTDAFCREHLDEDYRRMAQRMAAALSRKRPSPLASGQPRTWAAGIVHTLGRINFLSDRSFQPTMTTADLCSRFGVGLSTVEGKAKIIADKIDARRWNHQRMVPSILASSPMTWLAEVNGFLVDLRTMPRDCQQVAFDKGMIPYIPADQGMESA